MSSLACYRAHHHAAQMRKIVVYLGCLLLSQSLWAYELYSDRSAFLVDTSQIILDDYEARYPNGLSISDSAMSSVLGETEYVATGHPDGNSAVGKHPGVPGSSNYYCAGCNGSFLLDFTSTSVGDTIGVYGVGIDIRENREDFPYFAFVTFGNNATAQYVLPFSVFQVVPNDLVFWGIASAQRIKSVHFGLEDGGVTTSGSFAIDNLIIAGQVAAAPATASLPLMILGMGLIGACWRPKRSHESNSGATCAGKRLS